MEKENCETRVVFWEANVEFVSDMVRFSWVVELVCVEVRLLGVVDITAFADDAEGGRGD